MAYNILGHAFFLEDGIEKATVIDGNLGALIGNVKNQFDTDRMYVLPLLSHI